MRRFDLKVIKGLLCFILMVALSICISLWVSLNIVGKTVLSSETNTKLLNETEFTTEIVAGVLDKYNTNMGQLSFEEDDLMNFVNESGEGVVNYVFLEEEQLPSVNVSFIKNYINDIIEKESSKALEGNIDVVDFVEMLKEIPEGESISITSAEYFTSLGIEFEKAEFDSVIDVYMENKEESNEVIVDKIVQAIAREVIDIESMKTELSLQDLFDKLTKRNPFTVIRNVVEVYNKDVNGYLLVTVILLMLMIIVTEYRISRIATWFSLSMVLAIIPLQLIRLANYVIDKDFLNLFEGMSSYSDFMMNEAISKLNKYTIVFTLIILIMFIISKVFRKKSDVEDEKVTNRYRLVRLAGIAVVVVGLYFNSTAAYDMNLTLYDEVSSIELSDFDIGSIDLTLRELLNVDYDF